MNSYPPATIVLLLCVQKALLALVSWWIGLTTVLQVLQVLIEAPYITLIKRLCQLDRIDQLGQVGGGHVDCKCSARYDHTKLRLRRTNSYYDIGRAATESPLDCFRL